MGRRVGFIGRFMGPVKLAGFDGSVQSFECEGRGKMDLGQRRTVRRRVRRQMDIGGTV